MTATARPARRPLFEETETEVNVRDLQVGDFLVRYLGGEGIRPAVFNSGISEATPTWDGYAYRAAVRGGSRMPVESVVVRTLAAAANVSYVLPSHHRAIVRRRLSAA